MRIFWLICNDFFLFGCYVIYCIMENTIYSTFFFKNLLILFYIQNFNDLSNCLLFCSSSIVKLLYLTKCVNYLVIYMGSQSKVYLTKHPSQWLGLEICIFFYSILLDQRQYFIVSIFPVGTSLLLLSCHYQQLSSDLRNHQSRKVSMPLPRLL